MTLRLPSVCCGFTDLRSSCLTTTDVRKRLSHKIRPPALPLRTNKRCRKDKKYFRKFQIIRQKLTFRAQRTERQQFIYYFLQKGWHADTTPVNKGRAAFWRVTHADTRVTHCTFLKSDWLFLISLDTFTLVHFFQFADFLKQELKANASSYMSRVIFLSAHRHHRF